MNAIKRDLSSTLNMVKTCESWIPPSPNLDKVTVSFDKLNNTDLFPSRHGVYMVNTSTYSTEEALSKANWIVSRTITQPWSIITKYWIKLIFYWIFKKKYFIEYFEVI